MRRIVVTGIGMVLPVGAGKDQAWQAVCAGQDGASEVSTFDASGFGTVKAAEIKDVSQLRGRKSVWAVSRGMIMGFAAAKFALEDSKITVTPENKDNIGVVYGSTLTGLAPLAKFDQEALRNGPRIADPLMFPSTGSSAPACQVSIVLGVDAFNTTLSNGQTASLDAIQYGMQFIDLGRATTVLAGGVEDLCFERFFGYHTQQLLASSAAKPFDSTRTGMLMGEGSAVLVLEDLDHAKGREAPIYAEIAGYGSCLTPRPEEANEIKAGVQSMERALREAAMEPDQIDVIFAGGNGSQKGDMLEAHALSEVFHGSVPTLTAVKSMLGETYSAAGAIQSAMAALALHHQTVPGTIHFTESDSQCPIGTVVVNTQPKPMSSAMVNTFGSSGNFASLILKAYEN
jgi:3-oxoacyl-[acyl-carrier-protein] synthase II